MAYVSLEGEIGFRYMVGMWGAMKGLLCVLGVREDEDRRRIGHRSGRNRTSKIRYKSYRRTYSKVSFFIDMADNHCKMLP